jgi:hypothetical protein
MARTVIDQEKIKEINISYLKNKTYAAVARELGIAASTVKKYIIPNFTLDVEEIKFTESLIVPISEIKISFDDYDICSLSDDEYLEIQELWKECMM